MEQSFGDATAAAGVIGIILTVLMVIFLIGLLPTIFYLLSLQKAFRRCQPRNRSMEPGLVWLLLIPIFNLIWHFFIVNSLSDAMAKEFAERDIPVEAAPAKSPGLAMCILNACSIIPYLGALTGLAGFVCWIIYWVKVADYSSKLAMNPVPYAAYPIPER